MSSEGIVDTSSHSASSVDVNTKKVFLVERDDITLGYFLTKEEGEDYLRRVVTHEYVSLLPTNHIRVVEKTYEDILIVEMYATLRDTVFLVESLHTYITLSETDSV